MASQTRSPVSGMGASSCWCARTRVCAARLAGIGSVALNMATASFPRLLIRPMAAIRSAGSLRRRPGSVRHDLVGGAHRQPSSAQPPAADLNQCADAVR